MNLLIVPFNNDQTNTDLEDAFSLLEAFKAKNIDFCVDGRAIIVKADDFPDCSDFQSKAKERGFQLH